jgi:hypothetical protein
MTKHSLRLLASAAAIFVRGLVRGARRSDHCPELSSQYSASRSNYGGALKQEDPGIGPMTNSSPGTSLRGRISRGPDLCLKGANQQAGSS